MHDTIVIGSGIFGSVIARHLRALGQDVCVVDDARPDSGSKPAGCVIRPSWVSSLSKADLQAGLDLLDTYYTLREGQFRIAGTPKNVTCFRVEPSSIIVPPDEVGRVLAIDMGHTESEECCAVVEDGPILTARRIVVAAGLWTPVLCPWVETWGRWGWSFRGSAVKYPVISMWAPFKQVVAFNMDDGRSWSGDGSALIEKSADAQALLRSASRCQKVVGGELSGGLRGVRPYAETHGKPCLISGRGNVWAVTGGAKNGTIAAAWAARRLQEEMGL